MYKTTKQDFELFKKECIKLKNKLGLNHFELVFKHKDLSKDNIDGASSEINSVGYATLTLDTEIDDKNFNGNVKEEIKSSAIHEMCHILTSRLEEFAYMRNCTRQDIYDANEELVRKITYLITNNYMPSHTPKERKKRKSKVVKKKSTKSKSNKRKTGQPKKQHRTIARGRK